MRPSSSRFGFMLAFACLLAASVSAEVLRSPTWGFRIDLPEGFAYQTGDGKNRFSFAADPAAGLEEAYVDLVVYQAGRYASLEAMAVDVRKRLAATGGDSAFAYRGRGARLLELNFVAPFGPAEGWALALELPAPAGAAGGAAAAKPLLLALAYGKAKGSADLILSALDSIAPTAADELEPGPLTAFAYPPEGAKTVILPGLGVPARIDAVDAAAAADLVDREFRVLQRYDGTDFIAAALLRYYRAIYRDGYARLADVAFAAGLALSRPAAAAPAAPAPGALPAPAAAPAAADPAAARAAADLDAARAGLAWVQGFVYEGAAEGADFVDLVSAATEGRGDCDSRALLLALILRRNNIPATMMVSPVYGHAMALVGTAGQGIRYSFGGKDWLVAETTKTIGIGQIARDQNDPKNWLYLDLDE